jgi:succinate dehydrogenase/fumarate reductase-like Fe-S protein
MKTNHDGTITLNAYDTWTSCGACGQRVTGDSIHTCSPQLKELTDEEIGQIWKDCMESPYMQISNPVGFARAILRKAQEK